MVSPVPMTIQSRRVAQLVAVGVFCVYLATAGGGLTSIDAVMTYEVTKSLVSRGSTSFDAPGLNHHRGVDGRYYSPFGIGQSIFNIPFYLAGRAAREVFGLRIGRADSLEKAVVALGSAVAAAGVAWVVCLFAWRLSGDLAAARRTALALAFGTLLWPYSKFGFNAALTSLCLTAGIYAAWVGVRSDRRRLLAWAGFWLACAFLTRHEMAVAVMIVAVWVAFESGPGRHRQMAELWLAIPLAAALAFWLGYNFTRFGSPFDTGNLGEAGGTLDQYLGFGESTLVGIHGLLLSPGRSLFIYVPLAAPGVLALANLFRRDRSTAALFAALLGSFLVLYGSLHFWDGLRGYGPRYLVPLLPVLVVPLVWWLSGGGGGWRRTLRWLAVLSVLVQLPGVVVDFSKVSVAYARAIGDYSREAKIYSWRDSALAVDTRAAITAVGANARYLVRGERPAVARAAVDKDDRDFAQGFDFSLDFWWLYLYYLGVIPAPVSLGLGMFLLVLGGIALRKSEE